MHSFESAIALGRIEKGVPAPMLNPAPLQDVQDVHW
jgi:hypothetical protein